MRYMIRSPAQNAPFLACDAMSDNVNKLTVELLVREVENVVEWYRLGTYLGLGVSEIKEIEQNYHDVARRRMAMLDKWVKKELNPSWDKVIAALESMSEMNLANQLKKKYSQQSPGDISSTRAHEQQVAELKIDRRERIVQELETLEKKYLKLVVDTELAVMNTNPMPTKLKRFSQFYTNDEVTTVEELFDQLKPFCFLDYSLLETIISFFLDKTQQVVSNFNDYVQQLTAFKLSTTLQQFMATVQKPLRSTKEGTCTVTLRLVGGWLTKTIEDMERLLKEIFQDKKSILTHLTVVRGSVIVTYCAPRSEADSLVMLALRKHSFMAQVGVFYMQIADIVITSSDEVMSFSFESSLLTAVNENNVTLLTFLLNINTSPDATDSTGWTALMYASYDNKFETANILLTANANPNYCRVNGTTALYMACQNGHSKVVDILLRANANPNLCRDDDTTPLYMACQDGHSSVVDLLLKANVNPNFHLHDGTTPLLVATRNGHTNVVNLLLQAKANPNLSNDDGSSPIIIASLIRHFQIIHLLLMNGADPNVQTSSGVTALMCACREGCLDSTELLLINGADPSLVQWTGLTALDLAASSGHQDIVDLLQAIKFSMSSTSLDVFSANEITTNIDDEAMNALDLSMEELLLAKTESFISTQYMKLKKSLFSENEERSIL